MIDCVLFLAVFLLGFLLNHLLYEFVYLKSIRNKISDLESYIDLLDRNKEHYNKSYTTGWKDCETVLNVKHANDMNRLRSELTKNNIDYLI